MRSNVIPVFSQHVLEVRTLNWWRWFDGIFLRRVVVVESSFVALVQVVVTDGMSLLVDDVLIDFLYRKFVDRVRTRTRQLYICVLKVSIVS